MVYLALLMRENSIQFIASHAANGITRKKQQRTEGNDHPRHHVNAAHSLVVLNYTVALSIPTRLTHNPSKSILFTIHSPNKHGIQVQHNAACYHRHSRHPSTPSLSLSIPILPVIHTLPSFFSHGQIRQNTQNNQTKDQSAVEGRYRPRRDDDRRGV